MDVLVTSYYYCKVRILKDDDVRYNVIIVHVYRHARRRFSFNAGRPASALPGLAPAQLRTHGIVHIDRYRYRYRYYRQASNNRYRRTMSCIIHKLSCCIDRHVQYAYASLLLIERRWLLKLTNPTHPQVSHNRPLVSNLSPRRQQ